MPGLHEGRLFNITISVILTYFTKRSKVVYLSSLGKGRYVDFPRVSGYRIRVDADNQVPKVLSLSPLEKGP